MFSNIVSFTMAKCKERKSLPTLAIFFRKTVFYRTEMRMTVLKQPIRIEYLIKRKPRGGLALQVKSIAGRQKGLIEKAAR